MSQEIIYTSAPRGLKPGSSGFCTVASTPGMAKNLAERLESLSGYRHQFPPGDPHAHLNPVAYSHLILKLAGQKLHVLSRVSDAGLDYSHRTNKLAHHVALDSTELVPAGPAWVLSQPGFVKTNWSGEPRILSAGRLPPPGSLSPAPCRHWERLTGDAGWAGVLANNALQGTRPAHIIFPSGMDVLPLVLEAQALLQEPRRWEVSFSTYFTRLPPAVECQWRFVVAGSPEAALAAGARGDLVIDLCQKLGEPPPGPLVEAARTGIVTAAPRTAAVPPPVPVSALVSPQLLHNASDQEDYRLVSQPPPAPRHHGKAAAVAVHKIDPPAIRAVPPASENRKSFYRLLIRGSLGIIAATLLVCAGVVIGLIVGKQQADGPVAKEERQPTRPPADPVSASSSSASMANETVLPTHPPDTSAKVVATAASPPHDQSKAPSSAPNSKESETSSSTQNEHLHVKASESPEPNKQSQASNAPDKPATVKQSVPIKPNHSINQIIVAHEPAETVHLIPSNHDDKKWQQSRKLISLEQPPRAITVIGADKRLYAKHDTEGTPVWTIMANPGGGSEESPSALLKLKDKYLEFTWSEKPHSISTELYRCALVLEFETIDPVFVALMKPAHYPGNLDDEFSLYKVELPPDLVPIARQDIYFIPRSIGKEKLGLPQHVTKPSPGITFDIKNAESTKFYLYARPTESHDYILQLACGKGNSLDMFLSSKQKVETYRSLLLDIERLRNDLIGLDNKYKFAPEKERDGIENDRKKKRAEIKELDEKKEKKEKECLLLESELRRSLLESFHDKPITISGILGRLIKSGNRSVMIPLCELGD